MGKPEMKRLVCETLLLLPDELKEYVTGHIWYVSSPNDAWAFTLKGSEVKDQYLVILTDELWVQDKKLIKFTILHETGHAISGHTNSIGRKQSQEEVNKQEEEADLFASKYLHTKRTGL